MFGHLTSFKSHQKQIISIRKTWAELGISPRYLIISGGVGTLKSTACVWLLYMWIRGFNRKGFNTQKILVCGQTLSSIEGAFVSHWEKEIPIDSYSGSSSALSKRPEIKIGSNKISYTYSATKSSVGKGSDQIIKGDNISGFYFVQPELMNDSLMVDEMIRRDRLYDKVGDDKGLEKRAPCHLNLFDCNPAGPDHWIYKRYINNDPANEHFIGGDLVHKEENEYWSWTHSKQTSVLAIKTTPQTSVYSAETLAEWKRTMRGSDYDRMVNGLWVSAEGRIYEDCPTVSGKLDIDEYWIGMDPGTGRDPQSGEGNLGLVWIARCGDTWVLFDCKRVKFSGVDSLASIIEQVSLKHSDQAKFRGIVKDWHGGSGAVYATELRRHTEFGKMILQPAENYSKYGKVEYGIGILYQALKSGKLKIHTDCKRVIDDLHSWTFNDKGVVDPRTEPHLLAALRYVWIRVWRFFVRQGK